MLPPTLSRAQKNQHDLSRFLFENLWNTLSQIQDAVNCEIM
jgi:hypothetical protein